MSPEEKRLQKSPQEQAADRKKAKGTAQFWRACRFLYPYRGMIIISFLCALFVGLTNTAGLSTMAPIMQVLVKGDTIATWADREIAQRRLGLRFSNESDELLIVRVDHDSAAESAGLGAQQVIQTPPANTRANAGAMLVELSNPQLDQKILEMRDGRRVDLSLPPMPRYLIAAR